MTFKLNDSAKWISLEMSVSEYLDVLRPVKLWKLTLMRPTDSVLRQPSLGNTFPPKMFLENLHNTIGISMMLGNAIVRRESITENYGKLFLRPLKEKFPARRLNGVPEGERERREIRGIYRELRWKTKNFDGVAVLILHALGPQISEDV